MSAETKPYAFACFGAGWFAQLQLAAWHELEGARCAAVYNRTRSRGEELAARFGIPKVYDDAEELFREERLDFVDIVTNPFTLHGFVLMAARQRVPVICQKPMAPSVERGAAMVKACKEAGVPFLVHENWRWQAPIRALGDVLRAGGIGRIFRARITMVSARNVFLNEPTLSALERFILTDMGTHLLDAARFLFGEAESLYCQTQKVHRAIKGEDVATVMLKMRDNGATVTCEMGYPENAMERDCFPQTMVFVEGSGGTAEIGCDYRLTVTTRSGTRVARPAPARYPWSDPSHEVVDASIVECNRHLLGALRGEAPAETTGEDNLRTLALVYACYDSARRDEVVRIIPPA